MENFKIYYKDKTIELTNTVGSELPGVARLEYENQDTFNYAIKMLDANNETNSVSILYADAGALFKKFLKAFSQIRAAGGLVKGADGRLLVIFRHGRWDLPKGKLKRFENSEKGAIREVEEECGVRGTSVTGEFTPTFHLYELKGKMVIKKTFWYLMRVEGPQDLVPQLEEGITKVEWFEEARIPEVLANTYGSIIQVLKEYQEKFN